MAKDSKEQMLYSLFLDLFYSNQLYEQTVSDLTENLKLIKEQQRKSKKLLITTQNKFETLYGKKPTPPCN